MQLLHVSIEVRNQFGQRKAQATTVMPSSQKRLMAVLACVMEKVDQVVAQHGGLGKCAWGTRMTTQTIDAWPPQEADQVTLAGIMADTLTWTHYKLYAAEGQAEGGTWRKEVK